MPSVGPVELVIILFVVTIVFGIGWMSGTVESLGKGIRRFRAEVRGDDSPPRDSGRRDG
ncbi:MAG: twin-arginine translocase TatA/TatE family subunit [Chloroflexi bacterium]|nr:twin-arginine translocase TatA/TatE family subunit [Chloroflexota bacterium]